MIEEIATNVVSNLVIRALSPIAGKALNKIKTAGPEIANDFYSLWVKTGAEKTNALVWQILEQRGYKNLEELRVPSPKFALNYIQGASVEDEPELRKLWAKLLANAVDPKVQLGVNRIAFISVLKDLSPIDAKIIEGIYRYHEDHTKNYPGPVAKLTMYGTDKAMVSLNFNISQNEAAISIQNLERLKLLEASTGMIQQYVQKGFSTERVNVPYITDKFHITEFGSEFIKACIA